MSDPYRDAQQAAAEERAAAVQAAAQAHAAAAAQWASMPGMRGDERLLSGSRILSQALQAAAVAAHWGAVPAGSAPAAAYGMAGAPQQMPQMQQMQQMPSYMPSAAALSGLPQFDANAALMTQHDFSKAVQDWWTEGYHAALAAGVTGAAPDHGTIASARAARPQAPGPGVNQKALRPLGLRI